AAALHCENLAVERVAIVVPGASARARGGGWRLSATCLACVAAAEGIAAERAPVAVVFTGYAPGRGASEAEQMRDAWRGPPELELVLEPHARNTAENAGRTLPFLRERGIDTAIVVCSWLHQARVRFFFSRLYRDAGIRVTIVPVPGGLSPRALVWELAALPVAWSQRRRVR
ncbi:MAG: YdcF family protein, partial [Gaiellaceae bacterium]